MKTKILLALSFIILDSSFILSALAQGTAFTYQGRLNDGGNPANGSYDLRFILYDNSIGGNQQGLVLTNSATAVSNGLFIVTLDFGPVFPGAARWLDIAVRTNGAGSIIPLVPRQALTPTPYAITAGNVTPGAGLSGTYGGTVTFNNTANSFSGNGAGLINVNASSLNGLGSSSFWQMGGNNLSGGQFLGSLNNQALEFRANGLRVLRVEPLVDDGAHSNMVNIAGGSSANFVAPDVYGATLIGGGAVDYLANVLTNSVTADFGTVLGGGGNTAGGLGAIALGIGSTASGAEATALGGFSLASGDDSFAVSGGHASGSSSFASANSIASAPNSVAFGSGNAGGTNSFAMGEGATANGTDSVALGLVTTAYGDYSIALGYESTAYGSYGFAAGRSALSANEGAFVWADSQAAIFSSTANDQFLVRAAGGVGINTAAPETPLHVAGIGGITLGQSATSGGYTALRMDLSMVKNGYAELQAISQGGSSYGNLILQANGGRMGIGNTAPGQLLVVGTGGAYCNGTSWVNGSDRNSKEDFTSISPREVLEKVSALPITKWQYKVEGEGTKHIGPMAQDFHAAFGLNGSDDKHISTVDEGGVALAAIQGLNQKLEQKETEITELKARLEKLEQVINAKSGGDK